MRSLIISIVTLLEVLAGWEVLAVERWRNDFLDAEAPFYRRECVGEMCSTYAEKRNTNVDLSPLASGHSYILCACKTRYVQKDLGRDRYPRYVMEAKCHPKSGCEPLNFIIHILKRKSPTMVDEHLTEQDDTESPLPKSLQKEWDADNMPITVACYYPNK